MYKDDCINEIKLLTACQHICARMFMRLVPSGLIKIELRIMYVLKITAC